MYQGDIWEVLKNVIRVGKISSINPRECTARVIFSDKDGLVSYDLPIVVPKTYKDKYYYMPDIDEQVLCIFLPNSIQQGFILGSFCSDKFRDKVPFSEAEKDGAKDRTKVEFLDGTWIEYDRKQHILTADCVGKTIINAADEIDIKTKVINISGDVEVKGNIHASGTIIDDSGNTNHHGH